MPRRRKKTALILAGGGILGAAYEIGCLAALDRIFAPGFSTRRFDTYIGISAGSVIATLIANRIAPQDLFKVILNNEVNAFNWRRKDIYQLDARGAAKSLWGFVSNLYRIFQVHRSHRWYSSLGDLMYILQEQLPSGIFSLDPMQEYLSRAFHSQGVIDDFDELKAELFIPAYDLDLGSRVIFGSPGNRDVRICQAITASCAIPFFFRPYRIGDRSFIDGSYGRVTHIDIAIEQGAELIVIVNPRVPIKNDKEIHCLPSMSYGHCASITELGFSFVWEQSQRIGNMEDMNVSISLHRKQYPNIDILLIEPARDESLLFFQGPMNQRARTQVMRHGYESTVTWLKDHQSELKKVFRRHGIRTVDDLSPFPAAEAP